MNSTNDKNNEDMINWLGNFQKTVNELLDSENLQFTLTIWGADKEDGSKSKEVSVCAEAHFPFLDMEMFWNDETLNFQVHLKDNQKLKYLNNGSSHTKSCFDAIWKGVSGRLAKLTSRNVDTEDKRLNKLYPEHAKALEQAKLAPEEYPTLGDNQ